MAQGPFGLEMGLKEEALRTLTSGWNEESKYFVTVDTVPKPHPKMKTYRLHWHRYTGLYGVGGFTFPVGSRDRYGKIHTLFEGLLIALETKYSLPSVRESFVGDVGLVGFKSVPRPAVYRTAFYRAEWRTKDDIERSGHVTKHYEPAELPYNLAGISITALFCGRHSSRVVIHYTFDNHVLARQHESLELEDEMAKFDFDNDSL